jgi:hypothetical protein
MPVKRLILPPESVFGPGDVLEVTLEFYRGLDRWEMYNGYIEMEMRR